MRAPITKRERGEIDINHNGFFLFNFFLFWINEVDGCQCWTIRVFAILASFDFFGRLFHHLVRARFHTIYIVSSSLLFCATIDSFWQFFCLTYSGNWLRTTTLLAHSSFRTQTDKQANNRFHRGGERKIQGETLQWTKSQRTATTAAIFEGKVWKISRYIISSEACKHAHNYFDVLFFRCQKREKQFIIA